MTTRAEKILEAFVPFCKAGDSVTFKSGDKEVTGKVVKGYNKPGKGRHYDVEHADGTQEGVPHKDLVSATKV